MRNKMISCLVISVSHFLVCILSGALGWEFQMVAVDVASIFAILLAYRKVGPSFYKCLLVIAPFYLLYSISSIRFYSYPTFPIWIFGLIICLLTWFLLRISAGIAYSISLLSIMVAVGGLFIWPNTFSFINTDKQPGRFDLNVSKLVDGTGRMFPPVSFKGQVVLFDIWHSACLPCIKKFPVVESLYQSYRNDSLVRIITLNIPLRRDEGRKPERLTQGYNFEKLYFSDEGEYEKFSTETLPVFLIMDKQFKCRYAGDLNLGWNLFISNAKRIIEQLKNE